MFRRIAICAAFATWSLANFWITLAGKHVTYLLRSHPASSTLLQVTMCEALITAAMLAVWITCRSMRYRVALEIVFAGACLFPLGIASTAIARISPFDVTPWVRASWFWPASITVGMLALGLAARNLEATGRRLRSVLLWSWPALAIVLVSGSWTLFQYGPSAYADSPYVNRSAAAPGSIRVVWIIFDELSQAVAFEHRPRDLQLPNFDRLRSESFYATRACSPAGGTFLSMPSLILGERILQAESRGPAELMLQSDEHTGWFSWSSVPNVFDTARDAGYNASVVGSYHPYGRVLNRSLVECFWAPSRIEAGIEELPDLPWPSSIAHRLELQVANLPLVGHLRTLSPRRYQKLVRMQDAIDLREHALDASADRNIGLTLIHIPIPHPPGIFNRKTGKMDPESPSGYIDNVAFADLILGELRLRMEQAGVWDTTAVIVSADHGWRIGLWRNLPEWTKDEEAFASTDTSGVPFLVRMPRDPESIEYSQPFDTVVTRGIIRAILQRRITTARDVSTTIDQESRARRR